MFTAPAAVFSIFLPSAVTRGSMSRRLAIWMRIPFELAAQVPQSVAVPPVNRTNEKASQVNRICSRTAARCAFCTASVLGLTQHTGMDSDVQIVSEFGNSSDSTLVIDSSAASSPQPAAATAHSAAVK